MDFLDRKEEIAELERVLDYSKSPKFVVVFGRRRLGKSTLSSVCFLTMPYTIW